MNNPRATLTFPGYETKLLIITYVCLNPLLKDTFKRQNRKPCAKNKINVFPQLSRKPEKYKNPVQGGPEDKIQIETIRSAEMTLLTDF